MIAFTANAIGGAREMFMEEGFNDFIAKPIELSVLERIFAPLYSGAEADCCRRKGFGQNDIRQAGEK